MAVVVDVVVFKLVSDHTTRKSQSQGPNQDSVIAELALVKTCEGGFYLCMF